MGALTIAKMSLKAIGAVTGVLGTNTQGRPVKARKSRLLASIAALLVALMSWAGLPEPVAEAIADVGIELAADRLE